MKSHGARTAAGSAQVAERLRDHFRDACYAAVVSARLFGSHGAGRAHRESDVDVAILLDRRLVPTRPQRFDLRVRLTSNLSHALENNDVDLVVLNDAPPLLARHIIRTGAEVFCRDRRPGPRVPPRRSDPGSGPRAVSRAVPADDAGRTRRMTFLVERLSGAQEAPRSSGGDAPRGSLRPPCAARRPATCGSSPRAWRI